MVSTAISSEEEKKEYFDSPEELDEKTTILAQWIRESKMTVAFTGAGISTATGIPDYRSGFNTVLETGPGCWEKAAMREKWKKDATKAGKALPNAMKVSFDTTIQMARPSLTHMALVELQNRKKLQYVVS